MTSNRGIIYDGDFTVAKAVGPVRTEDPFAWDKKTQIFRQPFWQLAANFSKLDAGVRISPTAGGMTPAASYVIGAEGKGGPFLVEESPRTEVDGGIVEWDRVWAHVPRPWFEFPAYNYQKQQVETVRIPFWVITDQFGHQSGIWNTFTGLVEYSEPITSTVGYSYRFVPEGTQNFLKKIKALIPYRIIHYNDPAGRPVTRFVGTYGVAEATSARRWMGNIYEIRNVYVNPY
jgi:hypothetical protein